MDHPFEESRPSSGRANAVVRQCERTRQYCRATNADGTCNCELFPNSPPACTARWNGMLNVLYQLTGRYNLEQK